MTTHLQSIKRNFSALLAGALVAMSGIQPASAKDTDVYLKSAVVGRDDAPNVMIILDNSGSMNTVINQTRPAYDPTINYCTDDLSAISATANSGKPSNCATISGRVFWSFSNPATPPSNSSSNWFDSSKNKCLASASALSSAGFYGAGGIARFRNSGSSSNRGWKTLNGESDGNIVYVDCKGDGATDGQVAGDNTFPMNSITTAYTSTSSQAFNWSSFTSNADPVLYSSNYMNYWNNANLKTNITRLRVAKDAVKSIIDANPGVRFGLMAFNNNNQTPHGGRVLMRVEKMDAARRTTMKNVVEGLTADTFTPLAETMWEAYRYFGGLSVAYGNPSPVETPRQDSCAQNTSNTACNNGGYYDAIGAGNSAYNTGTYISPFNFGCQTGYVILVTDGDPTNDIDANGSSKITGLSGLSSCDGSSCLDDLTGWMHSHDVYNGIQGVQPVNTYAIGFGTGISASGKALLTQASRTKGGGEYYDATDTDELSAALQGAIIKIQATTTSFTAPSLSVNAFNKLFNRDDVYFALFSPSGTKAWEGNIKRFKLCNSSDVTTFGCTFGEVIDVNNAAAIDTSSRIKDTAVSYWGTTPDGASVTKGGAGAQITKSTNPPIPRTLYTYRGSYAAPATPVAIVATAGNSVYDAAINDPTILGLPDTSGSPTTTNASDTAAVATLIKWMRGQDAYDARLDDPLATPPDTGHTGVTDEARWNFADPLHSRPVAFTFGAELTGGKPDPNKPIIKLFVGTNDGMVRIINNVTGAEEWAFIPSEMLSQQNALALNSGGDHIIGMDDSPSFLVSDVDNDGVIDPTVGDKVYMYIGMRRGGRNLYAFDVTPTSKMTTQTQTITPKLQWVIQGGSGNFAQLGQTWSRPRVARIRAKCTGSVCDDGNPATNDSESRMVLIFGGGYDTNQDNGIPAGTDTMGNAIYIVDPFTGSRIWWASSNTGANLVLPGMTFSIPSEVMALDTNGDKSVDRVYVGDTGGQLWRIDLGDQIGASINDGSFGYIFADIGCTGSTRSALCAGTANQDRRKFFYPPDVAMVKDANLSTNENYDLVTIGSGDREDPLDLLTTNKSPIQEGVHNRIYAFRDYDYRSGLPTGAPTTTPAPIVDSSLYDATLDKLGTLTGGALQTEINNNVKTSKGWFIDLKEANDVTLTNGLTTKWVGEKVLAKTIIFDGTLFFTTYIPANDSTAKVTCKANEGEGRFYELNYLTGSAMYDLNGDSTLDRFGVAGGGIPSEVVIIIREGGTSGLVGTSGGAKQVNPGGGSTRYNTFWWDE